MTVTGAEAISAPSASQADAEQRVRLADEHLRELVDASGIDPVIVNERGYATVWGKNDPSLLRAGFSESQRRGYGWIAPLFSPLGTNEYIYKPTADPRTNSNGKAIKYEYPIKHEMILDCHPIMLPRLGDPSQRLWVTEGIKKGDALASRHEVAISLQGVFGWRGTNALGGAVALPDWECVALKGRDIYIVFDSDANSNPNVARARERLARFLAAKGARVQVVHLPAGRGGAKQGVDDFFVGGVR